jgi:hypothetical protein
MGQIARLPTRWELTKYAFVILARRGTWDRSDRGVLALSAGLHCALIPLFVLAIVSRASDKHPGYTSRR